MQAPLTQVSPLVQQVSSHIGWPVEQPAVQTSFRQRVPSGQHVPAHTGCALKQTGAQTPSWHVALSAQHVPPHIGWPLAQAGRVQTPWMQASSSEQRAPQELQLCWSVDVSTQVTPHIVRPTVQALRMRSALGASVWAPDAEEFPVSAVQPTIAPKSSVMPHPDRRKHSR